MDWFLTKKMGLFSLAKMTDTINYFRKFWESAGCLKVHRISSFWFGQDFRTPDQREHTEFLGLQLITLRKRALALMNDVSQFLCL